MKVRKYAGIFLAVLCLIFMFPSNAFGYTWGSRISGSDRYKTSVEISKSGWDTSFSVVLTTGENFPDALCSVPLAGLLDAPVLLTSSDVLNDDTEKEIQRLKAHYVYIIGGPGAVSTGIEDKLKEMGLVCVRIDGSDRYETSSAIAKYMASNFNIDSEAVLVSGEDFSDAVSVSSAAAKKRMPILAVSGDYISQSTRDFISQNNINKIYALGDNSVIGDEVINGLPNVERIAGGDKYQRNILILNEFENDLNFDTVYFATGENFPDALSCSALAAKNGSPVVLVNRVLSDSSESFMKSKLSTVNSIVAVGGGKVVSDSILENITRDSIDDAGAYIAKPYDELGDYLLNILGTVNFGTQDPLKIDKITVTQDSESQGISIFLDMDSENYNKLASYISSGDSAKSNIELWMKVMGGIASAQYPGKPIKGRLWQINSFDSRPDSYSTEDINYDPSTGKWVMMNYILEFSNAVDGQFEVKW